jgi:hypothetical protein
LLEINIAVEPSQLILQKGVRVMKKALVLGLPVKGPLLLSSAQATLPN